MPAVKLTPKRSIQYTEDIALPIGKPFDTLTTGDADEEGCECRGESVPCSIGSDCSCVGNTGKIRSSDRCRPQLKPLQATFMTIKVCSSCMLCHQIGLWWNVALLACALPSASYEFLREVRCEFLV
jgi:hypothetical protein